MADNSHYTWRNLTTFNINLSEGTSQAGGIFYKTENGNIFLKIFNDFLTFEPQQNPNISYTPMTSVVNSNNINPIKCKKNKFETFKIKYRNGNDEIIDAVINADGTIEDTYFVEHYIATDSNNNPMLSAELIGFIAIPLIDIGIGVDPYELYRCRENNVERSLFIKENGTSTDYEVQHYDYANATNPNASFSDLKYIYNTNNEYLGKIINLEKFLFKQNNNLKKMQYFTSLDFTESTSETTYYRYSSPQNYGGPPGHEPTEAKFLASDSKFEVACIGENFSERPFYISSGKVVAKPVGKEAIIRGDPSNKRVIITQNGITKFMEIPDSHCVYIIRRKSENSNGSRVYTYGDDRDRVDYNGGVAFAIGRREVYTNHKGSTSRNSITQEEGDGSYNENVAGVGITDGYSYGRAILRNPISVTRRGGLDPGGTGTSWDTSQASQIQNSKPTSDFYIKYEGDKLTFNKLKPNTDIVINNTTVMTSDDVGTSGILLPDNEQICYEAYTKDTSQDPSEDSFTTSNVKKTTVKSGQNTSNSMLVLANFDNVRNYEKDLYSFYWMGDDGSGSRIINLQDKVGNVYLRALASIKYYVPKCLKDDEQQTFNYGFSKIYSNNELSKVSGEGDKGRHSYIYSAIFPNGINLNTLSSRLCFDLCDNSNTLRAGPSSTGVHGSGHYSPDGDTFNSGNVNFTISVGVCGPGIYSDTTGIFNYYPTTYAYAVIIAPKSEGDNF